MSLLQRDLSNWTSPKKVGAWKSKNTSLLSSDSFANSFMLRYSKAEWRRTRLEKCSMYSKRLFGLPLECGIVCDSKFRLHGFEEGLYTSIIITIPLATHPGKKEAQNGREVQPPFFYLWWELVVRRYRLLFWACSPLSFMSRIIRFSPQEKPCWWRHLVILGLPYRFPWRGR